MSKRSRRSTRLSFLFLANCALFFCTLVLSTVTSLVVYQPSSPAKQMSAETYDLAQKRIQIELDAKYEALLRQASLAIKDKDRALNEIRAELLSGYVVAKDIEVTDSNQAYWLSEPNLMLGVSSLPGGRIKVNFANRKELISVGERIDFDFEANSCFLLLTSSTYGKANFRYACSPNTPKIIAGEDAPFQEARLN